MKKKKEYTYEPPPDHMKFFITTVCICVCEREAKAHQCRWYICTNYKETKFDVVQVTGTYMYSPHSYVHVGPLYVVFPQQKERQRNATEFKYSLCIRLK